MTLLNNIGDKFKNICFIGLDRVEYFHDKSEESITADTWQDVTDEQSRKNLALVFFSPRDLEGKNLDPYIYLSDTPESDIAELNINASKQLLQDIPLVDMCRIGKGSPNTVNILAVADVIFHWDVNGSYIQPTTPITWIKDLEKVKSTYPKTTKFNIYTNWEKEKLVELNMNIASIQEMPLEQKTWLNMPTFQEKYGLLTFLLSIGIAASTYMITGYQDKKIDSLYDEIRMVEQNSPNNSKYSELARKITEQEKFMRYKSLMPIVFKDVASSIYHAKMKADSFEIKSTQTRKPMVNLLATIKSKPDAYNGWLEEEPIAKSVLMQSISMEAIRKPPKAKKFILEGFISMPKLKKKILAYQNKVSKKGGTKK